MAFAWRRVCRPCRRHERGALRKDAQATYTWGIFAILALLAVFIVAGLLYVRGEVEDVTARHAPLGAAAEGVRLQTTLAHLWFEEILGGDNSQDIATV